MSRKPRIVRKQRGPNRMEENLGKFELPSRVQQDRGKVYEENEIPN